MSYSWYWATNVAAHILYYLQEHDGVAKLDDLHQHLLEQTDSTSQAISINLYHTSLPKLDDIQIVNYDQTDDLVRYQGRSLATDLIEWIVAREQGEN